MRTTVRSILPLAPIWTWQVGSPGGTLGKGEEREVWGFILLTPFLQGPLELLCPSPDSHWSSQAAYSSLISVTSFFSALHLPPPASHHSGHRDGEQHGDCQIQIIWIPRLSMALLSCIIFSAFFFKFLGGFPDGSDGKASVCNWGRPRFDPSVRKIPWRRQWQPTPVLLPGKSHGWRSLVGYSPCGCKESGMTEWLHFHFYFLFWLFIGR